jgi:adenosine deaminase
MDDAESGSISESLAMRILARRLPKAELHVHFLGAIRPSFPFASDHTRSVIDDYVNAKGFFSGLREVAASLLSEDMFEAATLRVLEEAMNAGCRHVEMMATPGELRLSPVPLGDALKAMGRAFDQKKRQVGLTGGLILETDRCDDPKAGLDMVADAMAARDAGVPVLGIGNDGDFLHPVSLFAPAFELAKKEGFHTTCHLCTLQDVLDGLQLPLDRVDHAYDLKGRPDLIARYKEAGLSITSGITACCFMGPGLFKQPSDHPADEFRRNGILSCIGTDDPAFYQTDLIQEYLLAQQSYGWTRQEMLDMAMASLEMAWIDGDDRERRLAAWRAEGAGTLADPRTSKGPVQMSV